jgi:hypothetical protein
MPWISSGMHGPDGTDRAPQGSQPCSATFASTSDVLAHLGLGQDHPRLEEHPIQALPQLDHASHPRAIGGDHRRRGGRGRRHPGRGGRRRQPARAVAAVRRASAIPALPDRARGRSSRQPVAHRLGGWGRAWNSPTRLSIAKLPAARSGWRRGGSRSSRRAAAPKTRVGGFLPGSYARGLQSVEGKDVVVSWPGAACGPGSPLGGGG